MDPITLARRNTLACLHHNLSGYRRHGNEAMASLFRDAIEVRYQLLAMGELQVGQWGQK
ncbi:hypothetical protein [Stenotrophomonas sp. ATCM1_4]|uniref:hypothetical protein n=1 Tax=Stenotrophomonas sp. ATCM1_4 TaxID=2259330 RepID=UPI001404564F|nr:hypothetical protein [Stenotrophomonas sp. ATCM1_4]